MIRLDHINATAVIGAAAMFFASTTAFAASHRSDGQLPPCPVDAVTAEELANCQPTSLQQILKDTPELITTARRTEQSVLDVPIAIRGISAAELESARITNLGDVANVTAGFSFQNFFGEDLSVPTMRGVGQVDIFGDPNTPVYVDGILISRGLNFGFLDVERIEVLKGPQPAYFGFNAFSGAVNFVSAKPSDEMEVKGEIQFGTDDKRLISTSISGPMVGDVLSGRISAMYDDFGGTYENQNAAADQDIGGSKNKILTGSLFYTPSDTFDAHLNLYISDDTIDPPAQNGLAANCEPELDPPTDPMSANPNRLLNYCGNLPSIDKHDLSTTVGETGEIRKIIRTSLNMNWDVGYGTFSSLTGFGQTKGENVASTDRGVPGTTYAYLTTTPGFIPGSFVIDSFQAPMIQLSAGLGKETDFSQEFRFSSPRDEAFRYTVGGYFRTAETRDPILEGLGFWAGASAIPADAQFVFPGGPPELCPCIEFAPGVGISAGFGGFIFADAFTAARPGLDYYTESDKDLWAGFFSTELDIQDDLTWGFQGRYTDFEEKTTGGPTQSVEKFTDDFFNWRTDLTWRVDDLTTVYGSIATGIKQGGIDNFTPETVNPDPDCPGPMCVDDTQQSRRFGQEKIMTIEAGYKTILNDGATRFNAAVYYNDQSDIVLPQIVTSVDGKAIVPEGVSANIGDAKIVGVELELTNKFNDSLDGGLTFSYNRARFNKGQIESFAAFPSFAPRGSMQGQTLQRQPELQVSTNATFRTQFNSDWELYTRGDVNYQSRWYVGLPNQARVPGRFRANASVGLESEQYTVELWVNNLFDDDTVEAAFRDVYLTNALPDGTQNFNTLFPWRLTTSHPTLRTIGVTLRGRF